MAKFVYRMQNILEIKDKMETQAKMQYAQARAKLNEEEAKMEALKRRRTSYEDEYRELVSKNLDVLKITGTKTAILRMDEFIQVQLLNIHVAQKNVEAAKNHLQEAMKERKTHEKLREHALEDFMHELNRVESKEIDELTSYTYGQKKDDE